MFPSLLQRVKMNLNNFVPSPFKNKTLSTLISNLFNKFLEQEHSLKISGQIGKVVDSTLPIVPQETHERVFNAIVPTLYSKTATEENSFSFKDLIDAMNVNGIDVSKMQEWMTEKPFNFSLPINYDKFVNFANYFWKPNPLVSLSWNPDQTPEYYVMESGVFFQQNDWQRSNLWTHRDNIESFEGYTQATRPIIEYVYSLEMNSIDSLGNTFTQSKNFKNQLPQFNLYYFDGTPSGKVSSIFFYEELQTNEVDSIIGRRITKTPEFKFHATCKDEQGRFYFFKQFHGEGYDLKSFWEKLVSPKATSKSSYLLNVTNISEQAISQHWNLVPNGTMYSIVGSKSGTVGQITNGETFVYKDFTLSIDPSPFEPNGFSFNIFGNYVPRSVIAADAETIIDADPSSPGAFWMSPERMFSNINRETRTDFTYSALTEHFRSVMLAQDGFQGHSFGVNNYRNLGIDKALGGTIKEFDKDFPLFLSLMNQTEMSPIALIDYVEQQTVKAYSHFDNFILSDLVEYVSKNPFSINSIVVNDQNIDSLLSYYEANRRQSQSCSHFRDSTSAIANWPLSMTAIGAINPVHPSFGFDVEIASNVLTHHDGHTSPLMEQNFDVIRQLINTKVTRSDGTFTPGISSLNQPQNPYKGQLWMNPSNMDLRIFVVDFDSTPINPAIGNFWFNRDTQELKQFDGTSWVTSLDNRWLEFDASHIRNSLLYALEHKLYNSVSPALSPVPVSDSAFEYGRFIAKYKLDSTFTGYVNTDAFTWNYSSISVNNASWFKLLEFYQASFGSVIPTMVPNLEPWKLLGLTNKPSNWDSQYASLVQPIASVQYDVAAVATSSIIKSGFPIIDGVQLALDDVVALTNQSVASENGIYIVKSGAWVSFPASVGEAFYVLNGTEYSNTKWLIYSSTQIIQARLWSNLMWDVIKLSNPLMKLSVNIRTDELIPPYVSSTEFAGNEAITNVIPASANLPYEFLQGGPIEIAWRKSIEYIFGSIRSAFKKSPLSFLEQFWGYSKVKTPGLDIDRVLSSQLPHTKFKLHGEKLEPLGNTAQISFTSISGVVEPVSFIVTDVQNGQTVFSVYEGKNLITSFDISSQVSFTSAYASFTDILVHSNGNPFNLGDTFVIDSNLSLVFYPSTVYKFNGFCQHFTQFLRDTNIDFSTSSIIDKFRKWEMRLGHRLGSLVRADTLKILGYDGEIASTEYDIALKKNPYASSAWFSALRAELIAIGRDSNNKLDQVKTSQGFIVPNTGDFWTFKFDNYNTKHPEIQYYTLADDENALSFDILDSTFAKGTYKRKLTKIELKTISLPVTITGVQNAIDFVFGYVERLTELGFVSSFNDTPVIDEATGRNMSWQLEIEKFVEHIYSGFEFGTGYIFNPWMDKIIIDTPVGITSPFSEKNFSNVDIQQAIFDVDGSVIPNNNLEVLRTDNSTLVRSLTPIFSAHILTEEYEHTILFKSGFDSFYGTRIKSLYLDGIKCALNTKKPHYPGFIVSGSKISKNIMASVDTIGDYYDSEKIFFNPTISKHATSLFGYTQQKYLSDITPDEQTQFNFWKGMIQAKGTDMSVDAFTNCAGLASTKIDEYWAFKLAEYGDARTKISPELKISSKDVTQKITKLQFFDASDSTYSALPMFTQIESSDDSKWYSIDDLGQNLSFEPKQISETFTVTEGDVLPKVIRLKNTYHTGDNYNPIIAPAYKTEFLSSSLVKVSYPGTYTVSGFTWEVASKFSPVKLINYKTNELIDSIQLWHPAIGVDCQQAMEIIDIKSPVDPAYYSTAINTLVNKNYRHLKPWAKAEVGKVWWDTSNLGYTHYHDAYVYPDRSIRDSLWGSLADWASIDVFEWVESPVHPSAYNELAISQEGSASVPDSQKISGRVGFEKLYSRTRQIFVRPIAWSHAGNGSTPDAFGDSTFVKTWVSGNTIIADSGRVNAAGISSGRHFGGWKNSKPVGEVIIGTDLIYQIGTYSSLAAPQLVSNTLDISKVEISPMIDDSIGKVIGKISIIKKVIDTNGTVGIRLIDTNQTYQDIALSDWFSSDNMNDGTLNIDFDQFGLRITLTRADNAQETIPALDIANLFVSVPDVYIREGIKFTEILPLPAILFVNTYMDPDFINTEYEWRAWDVPTQDDLSSDLVAPNNSWVPFLGSLVEVQASSSIIADIETDTLTLSNGIPIKRYSTSWTKFTELKDSHIDFLADGINTPSYDFGSEIDSTKISVYVNGIQLSLREYTISGTLVSLNSVAKAGSEIKIIYRKYQPNSVEQAFNPDVEDKLSMQVQYKTEYEFTQVDMKDEFGNTTQSKYYFWVKNKLTSRKTPIDSVKQLLQNGPDQFMIFEQIRNGKFDSCSIYGLKQLVSHDDAFKLRFVKDFTLRDDPEEIKLKNTHTEWSLIRRFQIGKIPLALWNHIVNAVSGQDAGGNVLPSKVRETYDVNNGTKVRFGFAPGQIFVDKNTAINSVTSTIFNTSLTKIVDGISYPDQMTFLDFNNSNLWFYSASAARNTMDLIWENGTDHQVNEIFFNLLDDALVENIQFSDLFKTSMFATMSEISVQQQETKEQVYDIF